MESCLSLILTFQLVKMQQQQQDLFDDVSSLSSVDLNHLVRLDLVVLVYSQMSRLQKREREDIKQYKNQLYSYASLQINEQNHRLSLI